MYFEPDWQQLKNLIALKPSCPTFFYYPIWKEDNSIIETQISTEEKEDENIFLSTHSFFYFSREKFQEEFFSKLNSWNRTNFCKFYLKKKRYEFFCYPSIIAALFFWHVKRTLRAFNFVSRRLSICNLLCQLRQAFFARPSKPILLLLFISLTLHLWNVN